MVFNSLVFLCFLGVLQKPDLGPMLILAFVCLVTQLFHFLFAARAVTHAAALVELILGRGESD